MGQGLGPAAERLNKKGENRGLREAEYIPQSIVAVTEEVLVKEIIEFKSLLDKYPTWETDEDVDEHTPPPWKRCD